MHMFCISEPFLLTLILWFWEGCWVAQFRKGSFCLSARSNIFGCCYRKWGGSSTYQFVLSAPRFPINTWKQSRLAYWFHRCSCWWFWHALKSVSSCPLPFASTNSPTSPSHFVILAAPSLSHDADCLLFQQPPFVPSGSCLLYGGLRFAKLWFSRWCSAFRFPGPWLWSSLDSWWFDGCCPSCLPVHCSLAGPYSPTIVSYFQKIRLCNVRVQQLWTKCYLHKT